MKALPTNLGADRKKIAILGGLVVVLVGVFFLNRTPDAPPATVPKISGAPTSVGTLAPTAALPPLLTRTESRRDVQAPVPGRRVSRRRGEDAIQDFKPSLKLPEGTDVSRIDPVLKLDLLAKVRNLPLEGGQRSLFEFGTAPAPVIPKVAAIKPLMPPTGPVAPPAPAVPPPPPPPPAIPLKFYGYVNGASTNVTRPELKRAFFLDGEDIVVAGENDMIRNRFRVIRININSALVEDTTTKSQQTLPLVEELPG